MNPDPVTRLDILIADRGPTNPLRLSFDHAGRAFGAVVACESERTRIVLSAQIGTLPYSAEARERRTSLLRKLRHLTPPHLSRVRVSESQDIFLDVEATLAAKPTMTSILAGIVQGILTSSPLIEHLAPFLADQIGARPA